MDETSLIFKNGSTKMKEKPWFIAGVLQPCLMIILYPELGDSNVELPQWNRQS